MIEGEGEENPLGLAPPRCYYLLMADNTDNMVPRLLETIRDEQRAMRGDVNKLTTSHENLTAEVRISNAHVAALVQSDVHTHQRLAEVEARVDRIERRLQLVDPAQDER